MEGRGLLALLVASLCFGSAAILIRLAYRVQPVTLAFLRLAISAAIVAGAARALGQLSHVPRNVVLLLLISGFMLGLHFASFVFAVKVTTVSNATFLVSTSPIFLAALAPLLIHESATRRELLALSLGVTGVLVATMGGGPAGGGGSATGIYWLYWQPCSLPYTRS